jgi:histone H3/H4
MENNRRDKMNKAQLKKLIKPVVKECIQEVLIEEGLLTEVVSQVAEGMSNKQIAKPVTKKTDENLFNEDLQMKRKAKEANQKLREHRKRLLDSIGKDAYNGVDLGGRRIIKKSAGTPGAAHRPNVLGDDPEDSGVDISSLVGNASKVWQALK